MIKHSLALFLLLFISFIGINAQDDVPEISYSGTPKEYVIAEINGEEHTTSYELNALNQLVRVNDPTGQEQHFRMIEIIVSELEL